MTTNNRRSFAVVKNAPAASSGRAASDNYPVFVGMLLMDAVLPASRRFPLILVQRKIKPCNLWRTRITPIVSALAQEAKSISH
jgi:hypothetical protein